MSWRIPPSEPKPLNRNRGVTLIELVTVMGIIGLLAAIAYPSYMTYVRRSNRTDATRTMTQDAQALQRCYSANFTYLPVAPATCPVVAGTTNTPNNYYAVTIQLNATDYTITAAPQNGQAGDSACKSFKLLSSGKQTAQNASGLDSTSQCWGSR